MLNTLKTQVMKRLLTIGLMLTSAFALTNCSEQLVSPDQENDIIIDVTEQEDYTKTPYEVYIDNVDTKTAYYNEKTIWNVGDGIALYSKPSSGSSSYSRHEVFTYVEPEEGAKKRFEGFLNSSLAQKNDWYFIYPYGTSSSSGTTIDEVIAIGAEVQNQLVAETNEADKSKVHLAGSKCPLYGTDLGVKKSERPSFKMNYLYSVVAINIENKTGGDIAVDNVGFKANEDIVGQYKIDISNGSPSYTASGNNSAKTTVKLSKPVKIDNEGSYKLYLAIKPFVAAAESKITIYVNGSYRAIEITETTSFEPGKITTINVPINTINSSGMFGPISSNLLGETGYGAIYNEDGNPSIVDNTPYIKLSHPTPHTMIINGQEENNVFILGDDPTMENAQLGTVTITGTPAKLIDYAPLGFYVSSWKDKQAIMRVESITAYVPVLGVNVPITFNWEDLTESLIKDKKKIQFAGMVQLDQVVKSDKTHLVILDEEPYHKKISEKKINDLLANFDDNKTDDKNGYIPTLAGLKAALQNPSSLPDAKWVSTGFLQGHYEVPALTTLSTSKDITAYIIWEKMKNKLSSKLSERITEILFKSPKDMFEMVYNQPVIVLLSTRPNGEVSEADPNVIANDPRIVVWGLDSPNVND